jgi:hypothetical protein
MVGEYEILNTPVLFDQNEFLLLNEWHRYRTVIDIISPIGNTYILGLN